MFTKMHIYCSDSKNAALNWMLWSNKIIDKFYNKVKNSRFILVISEDSVFADIEFVNFDMTVEKALQQWSNGRWKKSTSLIGGSLRSQERDGWNQICVGCRVSLKEIASKLTQS